MKRKTILKHLFLSFLLTSLFLDATQAVELSSKSQISILTGLQGGELHTIFGHTAIRVHDHLTGLDVVYNYGTFDADTPHFIQKFVLKKLRYSLSIDKFNEFYASYLYTGRSLVEQILNLTLAEKQAIFDFLQNNFKEAHRYYYYDFFFDNCTTRPRDVLQKVLQDKIMYPTQISSKKMSYRRFLKPYLREAWLNFGFNLTLGAKTDEIPNAHQTMFMPEKFMDGLDESHIKRGNKIELLVIKKQNLNQVPMSVQPTGGIFSPTILFWTIFVLVLSISVWGWKVGKSLFWLDFLLFNVVGLAGYLFLYFWLFSGHSTMWQNWNMLWAFPLHFPLTIFLFFKKSYHWLKYYFLGVGVLQCLLLAGWYAVPQSLPYPVIPLILMLAIRAFYVYRSLNK
jgi:hypothetical protein